MPGNSVDDILADIRQQFFDKKITMRRFKQVLKEGDVNGNGLIDDVQEFEEILNYIGIFLGTDDLKKTFNAFDLDNSGSVSLDEFYYRFRAPLNSRRLGMIQAAFDKMNANGDGVITVADLKGVYDVSNHPEVIKGEKTEDEALADFLNGFDGEMGNDDGTITFTEWSDYYTSLGATIPSDDYFVMMLENCWKIKESDNSAEVALSAMQAIVKETCRQKCSGKESEALKMERVMKRFDTDESGNVSEAEFKEAMKVFGLELNDKDTGLFFGKYDKDGSGRLDYKEMKAAIFAD